MRCCAFARSLTTALLTTTALSPLGLRSVNAQSLPTGASVAYGSVGFQRSSGTLTINQSSQTAIVNYNSFSIGRGNTVNINQPNASSAILNRVTGNTPSTIAGLLRANGQVYLVNPNGIAITKTGVVKVGGGFVASSLGISDLDFKSGRRQFRGSGASARVSNAGTITIGRGGYAALIGGEVRNSGTIAVPMGKVGLGSGELATLDVSGDGFLQVALPTTSTGKGALVSNSGLIAAAGGTVVLDAATARAAARNAINISGTIDAHSISGHNGAIVLGGGAGGSVFVSGTLNVSGGTRYAGGTVAVTGRKVRVSGTIDASGRHGGKVTLAASNGTTITGTVKAVGRRGKGGAVTITGLKIALAGAQVDASGTRGGGTVKIGGDLHGSGPLPHAGTVTIDAKSVIRADAIGKGDGGSVVVWSDETTSFAGQISAKGGAQGGDGGNVEVSSHGTLAYAGSTVLTAAKGAMGTLLLDPYDVVITSATDSATSSASSGGKTTYTPSGTSVISNTELQTQLASANVTITTGAAGSAGSDAGNITVAAPVTWSSGSLLTLTAANAIAIDAPITIAGAGKLALNDNTSSPANLSFGAGARVTYAVGSGSGISGQALSVNGTTYTLIYSQAQLNGIDPSGNGTGASAYGAGLSGNYALATPLTLAGTYSQAVIGENADYTGAFAGLGNTISNLTISTNATYAGLFGQFNGTVEGVGLVGGSVTSAAAGSEVGGLVGVQTGGTITSSYATGAVSGSYSGGLVGLAYGGAILSSYATGAVSGSIYVGGLVGGEQNASITSSYATGAVSGGAVNGGLLGLQINSTITSSYATGAVSGGSSSDNGGLVGYAESNSTIASSYATGMVSGDSSSYNGGLVGYHDSASTIASSYWDTTTSGVNQGVGSGSQTGVTAEMTAGLASAPVLAALNSNGVVWGNAGNQTTPYLLNNPGPVILATDTASAATSTTPTFYTPVLSVAGLQAIDANLAGNYVLGQNLDATNDTGFTPINGETGVFSGTFNGLGHTISNLTISSGADYVGLFGEVETGGTVENVGLVGGSVTDTAVGGNVGGLAGFNQGTIKQADTTGTVTGGGGDVGGLAGENVGTITQSYATGTVTGGGGAAAGGLVGVNLHYVTQSYATGAVTGGSGANVGGLVGLSAGPLISQSYATGTVKGGSGAYVGGLVGQNDQGTIAQAYATGVVTGDTGKAGGLVGQNYDTIKQSYWDTTTNAGITAGVGSNMGTPGGVTAVTTQQLAAAGTLAALNSNGTVWGNAGNQTTPYLLANPGPVYLATDTSATPTAYTPIVSVTGLQAIDANPTGNYVLGQDLDATGYAGFTPIAETTAFTGTLNGLGHTISNLTISSSAAYAGLFGQVGQGGMLENIGLVGGSVTDTVVFNNGLNGAFVGGLAAYNNGGTITQAYATGTVTGGIGSIGGLVGTNVGTITRTYATGTVTGGSGAYVGGLVGTNYTSITQTYATGAVTGGSGAYVGGLVGSNVGTITAGYYDTQTTGQATGTQSDGSVGLTTAQLQSNYNSYTANLGSAFSGGTGWLYPYLTAFFPTGVQAVSGIAYKDAGATPAASGTAGAVTVSLDANTGQVVNGQAVIGQIAQATTGANGYYYAFVPAGTLAAGSLLVSTSAATGGTNSATLATPTTPSGNQTGVALYGNAVTVPTTATLLSQAPSLTTAQTSATAAAGTDTMAAVAIAGTTGRGLIATGASFTIDTSVTSPSTFVVQTAAGAPLTVAAPITIQSGGALGLLSGGTLTIDNAVTAQGAVPVTLTAATSTVPGTTTSLLDLSFAQGDAITYTAASSTAPATSSQGGALSINGTPYTLVYTATQLDAIDGTSAVTGNAVTPYGPGLAGAYALAGTLDATGLAFTTAPVAGGNSSGALPAAFSGTLEGLGHAVSNLTISGGSNQYVGLIGVSSGTVRDIGINGGSIGGLAYVGGLAGYSTGTVAESYATGTVTGSSNIGGLVGDNGGTISQVSASGVVTSTGAGYNNYQNVGGLVGLNQRNATISQSDATGAVIGSGTATNFLFGGLVGQNNGTIGESYATGSVTATGTGHNIVVGGLVGDNFSTVQQSYATGSVAGTGTGTGQNVFVGGLVGWSPASGSVSQSYATGAAAAKTMIASANSYSVAGGLIGFDSGAVTQAYATGAMTGTGAVSNDTGGLIGYRTAGTISSTAFDMQTTGKNTTGIGVSTGGTGTPTPLSTAALQSTGTPNPFGVNSGFAGGAAGPPAGSITAENNVYPYLTYFFPNGVQAITGTAPVGAQVGFYSGGTLLGGGTVSAGATNGYVYQAIAAGTLPASDTVKIGATVTASGGTTATGLVYTDAGTITNNVLPLGTIATGLVGETTAETTLSALQADVAATFGAATTLPTSANAATSITATGGSFTLDQPVMAGGSYSVTATNGPLTLASTLAASGKAVILGSAGTITQASGGTLAASTATLTGTGFAFNSSTPGSFTTTATTNLRSIGSFTLGHTGDTATYTATDGGLNNLYVGALVLQSYANGSDAGDMTVVDPTISNLAPITLASARNIAFGGTGGTASSFAGNLTLAAPGTVTQTGPLTVDSTLAGNGSTIGSVALGNSGNNIPTLGAFAVSTTGTGFLLSDAASGGLTLNGSLNTGMAPLALDVTQGAITQRAGTIIAGTLSGQSNGGASFTQANRITSLGDFSDAANGNLSLTSGVATLGVTGNVGLGTGTLTLTDTAGSINQTSGSITAGTLTGQSNGGASFAQANSITSLAAFNTSNGGLSVTSGVSALTVSGLQMLGTGTLTLTETGGTITQTMATGNGITAGTLTGSANGSASFGAAANTIGTLAAFSTGTSNGGLSLTDAPSALTVSGLQALGTGTLTLTAGGTISQAVGTGNGITAGALTGSANGSASFGATANAIGTLSAFSTGGSNGGLSLTDASALTVSGLQALGAGTLALEIGGAITQTTGQGNAITAGALTGAATGAATFAQDSNAIGKLDAFTAQSLVLGDGVALTVGGTVGTTGALTLTTAGNLTINSGVTVSGQSPVLAAAGAFVNQAGSAAVTATSGRWLVYSSAPTVDTFGPSNGTYLNSNQTAIFDQTFASLPSVSVSQTGNRYIFANPQVLTVSPTNESKVYGTAIDLSGDYTITGYQGVAGAFATDTAQTAMITGAPVISSAGSGTSAQAGTDPITLATGTLVSGSGYGFAAGNPAALTVTPAALTITANNPTKTYGAALPMLTASYSGFVNNDSAASLTTAPTLATTATASSSVGSYAVTASGAVDANYTIAYANGSLAVTPAALTIMANNQSKTYGQTATLGAYTETGLVKANGDTISGVTPTSPGAVSTATVAGSPYTITASNAQGHGLSNYTISYATGSLTVNPASVSVTATSGTAIYGNLPANPGLSATGLQNGEDVSVLTGLSSSFALTSRTDAGTYALGVVGTNTNPNYTVIGTSDGSYTITPRPITITATDQTRLPGYANAPLAYQIGGLGLVNSDFLTGALATSATRESPPGAYPIVQGTLAATPNYAVTFVPGTLVVSPALVVPATDLASTALRGFDQSLQDLNDFVLSSETGDLDGLASPIVPETGGLSYRLLCSKKACTIVPPNAKTVVHDRQTLSQLETRVR